MMVGGGRAGSAPATRRGGANVVARRAASRACDDGEATAWGDERERAGRVLPGASCPWPM